MRAVEASSVSAAARCTHKHITHAPATHQIQPPQPPQPSLPHIRRKRRKLIVRHGYLNKCIKYCKAVMKLGECTPVTLIISQALPSYHAPPKHTLDELPADAAETWIGVDSESEAVRSLWVALNSEHCAAAPAAAFAARAWALRCMMIVSWLLTRKYAHAFVVIRSATQRREGGGGGSLAVCCSLCFGPMEVSLLCQCCVISDEK